MFDATIPQDHSMGDSASLRNQFTSLKALIAGVSAGPTGPPDLLGRMEPTEPTAHPGRKAFRET